MKSPETLLERRPLAVVALGIALVLACATAASSFVASACW
jgi:hypothetical protein